MILKIHKEYGYIFAILWVVLFAFQELLADISSVFSYIDEAPLLLFVLYSLMHILTEKKLGVNKEKYKYVIVFTLFIISGLVGNVLYHYQPLKLVIIDLMTNLKFYGAICYFSMWIGESKLKDKYIPEIAKNISCLLTVLFLVDRIKNIFPAEYRYGIKSAVLFYGHPTYLAGICAFLIAVLTLYNPKRYKLYIGLDLVMLIFTLRSKAIVCALVYVMLYFIIKILHCKLKVWQIVVFAVIGLACAWSQIYFYFIKLGGKSARSIMLLTSLRIMKDYFPFGTGFATFASHSASAQVSYSPVYMKYGFDSIWELRNSTVGTFFDDQFWPIIIGQTGIIGTISYVLILIFLLKKIQEIYKISLNAYMSCLFIFVYLMVSSIAEPAFNNSVAVPFALVLSIAFLQLKQKGEKSKKKRIESKLLENNECA